MYDIVIFYTSSLCLKIKQDGGIFLPRIAKDHEGGTQSIERTISILNCFLGEKDALSMTEIAKRTGIPIPTASRITRLLAQENYLARNDDNKLFQIGRKLYLLGYRGKTEDTLRNAIYDILAKLRDEFGETAAAYVRIDGIRRCLEKAESFNDFRYSPIVGAEYSMAIGAGARVFLAFLCEEEKNKILSDMIPLTQYTIVDRDILEKDLAEIRKNGIAKSFGEYCVEFYSFASPIFDAKNNVICSIAVTGPGSRFTAHNIETVGQRLVEYSTEISHSFGWEQC